MTRIAIARVLPLATTPWVPPRSAEEARQAAAKLNAESRDGRARRNRELEDRMRELAAPPAAPSRRPALSVLDIYRQRKAAAEGRR